VTSNREIQISVFSSQTVFLLLDWMWFQVENHSFFFFAFPNLSLSLIVRFHSSRRCSSRYPSVGGKILLIPKRFPDVGPRMGSWRPLRGTRWTLEHRRDRVENPLRIVVHIRECTLAFDQLSHSCLFNGDSQYRPLNTFQKLSSPICRYSKVQSITYCARSTLTNLRLRSQSRTETEIRDSFLLTIRRESVQGATNILFLEVAARPSSPLVISPSTQLRPNLTTVYSCNASAGSIT
jgi:hypothetical protein